MNSKQFVEFIINFAIENGWNDKREQELIRSFFTTWCFIFKVDADTGKCDATLLDIYNHGKLENLISYDDFENFMVEHIV
ncbi:hypothetical protein B5F53_16985 [Blautia sp. An249]|uniref:hypothetical protein n=1 Tax=Blautia sp. An249 TaxID=1965603 RepID=UPI000B39B1A7|nr:hypothetical protein [Blautia sp. An249]OUO76548.1 hypothetical protein B5F53_16985 [Blautia sp. An249]